MTPLHYLVGGFLALFALTYIAIAYIDTIDSLFDRLVDKAETIGLI